MNLSLFIAKRYLFSKKSHNAINIISGISVAGVCIGTMALIIVLSAFNGLSELVRSLYNSFDSDIKITLKEGKTFDPNKQELTSLKKIKGVAYYTEILEENALLKFNDLQCIATIKGVDDSYLKMSHFDTLIEQGNAELKKNGQAHAVVGKGISYLLNIQPNEYYTPLSIYAPMRGRNFSINPEDDFNKRNTYVSGIFTINDDFDYKYVLVPIEFARELLGYNREVSSIALGLAPGVNGDKVQEEIQRQLGNKYIVKNRYQQNELLFKILESEKLWTFIILLFILIVATFNVTGSLTMLIIEKEKDIAILWNMGADVSVIRKIFLIEGLLITFIGAVLGLVFGTIVCWMQVRFKLLRFDEGYVVDAYPVNMEAMDFTLVLLIVLLIGFFAAWYPVRIFTKKNLVRGA